MGCGFALLLGLSGVPVVLGAGEESNREAASRMAEAAGLRLEVFADSAQVHNPAAIGLDGFGRLFVAEANRWDLGMGLRSRPGWLIEDLSIQRTADRLAMYRRAAANGGLPMAHWTAKADRVRWLEDQDGDGRADRSSVFADGFDDPLDGPAGGLLAGPGGWFFADVPNLWWLADADGDGVSESRRPLAEGFGIRFGGGSQGLRGPVWGPDGRIYWAVGDRGYAVRSPGPKECLNPVSGAIFRCEPDGSKLELYFEGLRNPGDLAFDQNGDLFVCDSSSGAWDSGRLVYVLEGGDSGWQAGYAALLQDQPGLTVRGPRCRDAKDGLARACTAWLAEGLCLPAQANQPAWMVPAVAAVGPRPGGLAFNPGGAALPGNYADAFFLCQLGGSRSRLASFAVRRKGAGFELRESHPGWLTGAECTDVDFGPDGKLYLSCSATDGKQRGAGVIYALFDPKPISRPVVSEARRFLAEPVAGKTAVELADWLSHEDMRVRLRAQFELARRGESSLPLLESSVRQTLRPLRRYHGIWALNQLARVGGSGRAVKCLLETAADADAEMRAQAAKALGDVADERAGKVLLALLADDDARVRCQACLAFARRGSKEGLGELLRVLEHNADADPFLRHAAVVALAAVAGEDELAKLASGQYPPAVRRGAVLALRRQGSARLREFLSDPEPAISREAVRAIHDLNLMDALTDVARGLDGVAAPREGDTRERLHHLRLINANWRMGTGEAARRLIAYACRAEIPGELRVDAVRALAEWMSKSPLDPVMGLIRPLSQEGRAEISGMCRDVVEKLVREADGELQAAALQLARDAKIEIPFSELKRTVLDLKLAPAARLAAWEELLRQRPGGWKELGQRLLEDPQPQLRVVALTAVMKSDPQLGVRMAAQVLKAGGTREKQQAVRDLAGLASPEAGDLLATLWSQVFAGTGDDAILLELSEAAASRPELADSWKRFLGGINGAGPAAAYRGCLAGGDAERGAVLFGRHREVDCAGCHRLNGDGAGSSLAGIGERRGPAQILAALVGSTAQERCVFPVAEAVSKSELRDLVAYLSTWKAASGP